MKTKFIIRLGIVLIYSSLSQNLFAQEFNTQGRNIGTLDQLNREYWQNQYNKGITEYEYEGSPFITSTDSTDRFNFENHEMINKRLRYNIYNDAMEVYIDGKYHRIKKTEIYTDFIIDGHHFIFTNNFENDKLKSSYLEQIIIAKHICFYKKHRVMFIKPESAKPFQQPRPAKFKTIEPRYYISINNNKLVSFVSKKEFLELFPNLKSEMKSFIKKNRLQYKNENDLVKIIAHIDTLLN